MTKKIPIKYLLVLFSSFYFVVVSMFSMDQTWTLPLNNLLVVFKDIVKTKKQKLCFLKAPLVVLKTVSFIIKHNKKFRL